MSVPLLSNDDVPSTSPIVLTDGSVLPMNLCTLCAGLDVESLSKLPDVHHGAGCLKHQPSFTVLVNSASTGCDMCTLFLEGVLETHCKEQNCSVAEAYQTFRSFESAHIASCLVGPSWVWDGYRVVKELDELRFWIPNTFSETSMDSFSGNGSSAWFRLRNACGLLILSHISRFRLAHVHRVSRREHILYRAYSVPELQYCCSLGL